MGTHNQTAVEVAANVAATTHTHTDTNTNNVNNQNEQQQQKQQEKEEEKAEEQQQQHIDVKEEKQETYKSVEKVEVEEEEAEKETRYNLPKAREPPQVVIIPATQASTVATNAAKKIRRAFSMPRNPFRWSRKFKTNITVDNNSNGNDNTNNNNTRHSTTIISCVSGGRANAGSTVSLNDSYQGNIGKDVASSTQPEQAKINNVNNNNNQHHYPDSNKKPITANNINSGNNNNNNNNINNKYIENNNGGGGNRIIRRSSLRKFLNRIAQHVSSTINVGVSIQSKPISY